MRLRHFETFRPSCPLCHRDHRVHIPLGLQTIVRREGDLIIEGMLLCPSKACQREYPIVDGIPLLIAGLRSYVTEQLYALTSRDDLSETLESALGDCAGPGSPMDLLRYQVSAYAWDHYALEDPDEPAAEPRPGSIRRLLDTGLSLAAPWGRGPAIDLGCSVGGGTFVLAERTDDLVLGIDMSYGMLRLASSVLRRGEVQYARRGGGLVYHRRRFPYRPERAENVDFWACDALYPPFAEGAMGLVVALNVIDCVAAPRELLVTIARLLGAQGRAIVTSPYDWSTAATSVDGWLGGHSQRGPDGGSSERIVRALLTKGGHPASVDGLRLCGEQRQVPWNVRLHDRAVMSYQVDVLVAEKEACQKVG